MILTGDRCAFIGNTLTYPIEVVRKILSEFSLPKMVEKIGSDLKKEIISALRR
jgi:hypothetical protein